MKKILFANKFFFLNGGSETVFFQERDFLLEKGFHVIDFSMQDPRNFPSPYSAYFIPHISFHNSEGIFSRITQAKNFIHSSAAVRNLEKLIHEERPDIAHLHNIYHQLTPAIIPVLKQHGIKVILTLHDGKLICPSYLMLNREKVCTACQGIKFWNPLTRRCQNSIMQCALLSLEAYWHSFRKSYDNVDLFISPSRFLADLTGKRIPAEKIRVLHNGIDHEKYQPTYSDKGYALYFGRLSKEKGIETLLESHRQFHRNFPLKIVGTGPLEEKIKGQYKNAQLLGYKHGEELHDIISSASFVIVPSEWYENCSMVVLESMAHGKAVIGSRIGGIPEQIEDNSTGFLFETGNMAELALCMKKMIENPALRQEFGKRARKKLIQEYSLKNHCQSLLEIYRQIEN